jgi:hypothetical protein
MSSLFLKIEPESKGRQTLFEDRSTLFFRPPDPLHVWYRTVLAASLFAPKIAPTIAYV